MLLLIILYLFDFFAESLDKPSKDMNSRSLRNNSVISASSPSASQLLSSTSNLLAPLVDEGSIGSGGGGSGQPDVQIQVRSRPEILPTSASKPPVSSGVPGVGSGENGAVSSNASVSSSSDVLPPPPPPLPEPEKVAEMLVAFVDFLDFGNFILTKNAYFIFFNLLTPLIVHSSKIQGRISHTIQITIP